MAGPAGPAEREEVLRALNGRLPEGKRLEAGDLEPAGPMVAYTAVVEHRYVLVRGGDPEYGNTLDMTVEV